MDGTMAEIRMFGGNFAPRGWALCNGNLLPIAQYDALFTLIGTTFGGDGQNTFALPDFRGRRPIGTGLGPGLSNYVFGETKGTESVTLLSSNLPMHTHTLALNCSINKATSTTPVGNVPAVTEENLAYGSTSGASMPISNSGNSGQNQPVSIISPYLAVNFIIAVEGVYPSRN